MKELLDLEIGFKENLPNSTIMIDLKKKEEELRNDVTSNCKQAIKKAQRHQLSFVEATSEEWDTFYNIRSGTASKKAFFILTKKMFNSLKEYVIKKKAGALMLVKAPNGDIVSGIIYLY
jgi:lipid II:glycine glycyltransferase (peptidoglycan interpeptide bridge formation enzyme)